MPRGLLIAVIIAIMISSGVFIPLSDANFLLDSQPTEQIGSVYDLGIIAQQERKDTKMLCLEGCSVSGPHAWDAEHESSCPHVRRRGLRASISMINSYYGGHLSQDRISYYVYEEYLGDGSPENDLGHGKGLLGVNAVNILLWALNGASIIRMTGKPDFNEIRYWIDSNRPILRDEGGTLHKITVIDGYELDGRLVHVIDPWTGTESALSYGTLDVFVVWVPIAEGITPRSDEPTIWVDSDGDGVVDFDEIMRFKTDPYNPDTDGDLVLDKGEIRSYTFLNDDSFDSNDVRKPDADGDGLRAELDSDSDNGVVIDGFEDINRNGRVDPGETDPFDPSDDPFLPVANFEYYPENPRAGDLVTFNASSSYDPNGIIVSYTWNFGDGNITSVTEPVLNYAYSKAGNYTISLNVTDNDDLRDFLASNLSVKMRTDLNGDNIISIVDVAIVAKAFGSKPGDENWNQTADLNDDKVISIIDVAQVARDFGKTA